MFTLDAYMINIYPQDILGHNYYGFVLLQVGLAFLQGSFVLVQIWVLLVHQLVKLFHFVACKPL